MALIVMKFGGSSVSTPEKVKHVADLVQKKKHGGRNRIVVIVSAPGDMTDELIDRAAAITENPDPREMDMLLATGEQISIALLSMAIKEAGGEAISFTGAQVGIKTEGQHTRAKIKIIESARIMRELSRNRIVIVAGFQGVNENEDITTLGRGGSDLTAIAIACVLKADLCEIYTDVDGVYTADPRVIKDARKMEYISYDEMLELASLGAQVMQARSIEVAKRYDLKVCVRSTFSGRPGTIITNEAEAKKMEELVISGVAYDKNQAKISICDVKDVPGIASKLFSRIAGEGISVDMIIQSSARESKNDISFTVAKLDLKHTLSILKKSRRELGYSMLVTDDQVAKISIVGIGMKSHSGVAARMFSALSKAGINIEMISTSEIKISCVVKSGSVEKALKAVHDEFELAGAGRGR